jgi:diguanylate cyclase (GGDEF)-like protein
MLDLERAELAGTRSYRTALNARVSRLAFVYLLVGVAATLVFFLLPPHWQNPAFDLIGLSGVVAIVVGTIRNKPQNPWAWYFMALGQFMFVAGDMIWTYYEEIVHKTSPFPSVADVSYLAAYVPLLIGLAMVVRARRPGHDLSSLIDAAIIAVAAAIASWIFLMAPQIGTAGASVKETIVSLAYPMADILLIAVMASLVFSTDMRAFSYRLISASLIALITADSLYTFASIHDWYATGSPIDAGWLLSYVLWGTAALHPSMRKLTEPSKDVGQPRYTRRRLGIEAAAVTAIPLMRVVQAIRGEPGHGTILAVGSALAGLLIIVRMGGLLGALESAALHDPLTSLPNRRLLLDRISQAFRRAERSGAPVAVLFLDLGGFKSVNDRFGHEAGDEALIEIGKRIVLAVRGSDTVARLGGDEFVIVCEGLSYDMAEALARRVRTDIAAPLEIRGDLVELTVDLGVAVEMAPERGDVTELLDAADRAMYHAKQAKNLPPRSED